ncbi:ubiquinone biosynthesis regulatory protein kinase UbiB [Reinekea marinisedimentorum]|uniref:Probable protein kinase UbiB n=1 Tax=Reinekea marinisedimentorum TaxID=230495 RepID=A0A4R3IB01_9GAMM|nr:ubiquinone biosynthesis regulatory protein kinase UbiB [Reinekea marinisedimentorum]TCS43760.1 ubiquinone biosynthesis protein [Reinekea marinisedimentorum]
MSLTRSVKIFWVLGRYRLDTLINSAALPWYARLLLAVLPTRWLFKVTENEGRRVRLALEHLGPVFIKFGQILSTRRDLLPDEMAEELAFLQDRVAPFASETARQIIESQLAKPIAELFAEFDMTPLASASIAQVHAARLHTGEEVVVKVIRPGIEKTIAKDIALMKLMARLLNKFPDGRRVRPVEVVEDYEKTIFDELDLLREGANAATLRRNTIAEGKLYVPVVYWEFTRKSVLVLERIYGTPVSDLDALNAAGIDFKVLGERGVEIFFSQVFKDSFFHADMHPGNVFVDVSNPASPTYIGIDCGIVGSLSPEDQSYLAQNLLAFFNRDYYRVAELHVESGWVPPETRINEFEAAIRSVCEPIFEKPISEISFGMLLIRLFQTARRFDMTVQPQLVLLQKTLLNIEGLGRQLYPELDLWKTAKPFLENWVKVQVGPKRFLDSLKAHGPTWLAKAPQMPDLVHDALTQMRAGSVADKSIQLELRRLNEQHALSAKRQRRRGLALVLAVVALASPLAAASLETGQWLVLAVAAVVFLWP